VVSRGAEKEVLECAHRGKLAHKPSKLRVNVSDEELAGRAFVHEDSS
jgi:hypothetical protein